MSLVFAQNNNLGASYWISRRESIPENLAEQTRRDLRETKEYTFLTT